jgi:enoyl-CoA hydratase/carnithine racemase
MKANEFKDISYQPEESGLVTLVLNRPERRNAMSLYTFYELFQAMELFEKDATARALLITGAKDETRNDPAREAFSSGGYFSEAALKDIPDDVQSEIDWTDLAQKKLTMKMYQCYKPIVVAMNGMAIGAGFTMPFATADLIYMSEHAWIQMPFTSLGIVSELASSFLLPRYLGFQKAKEIIYFAKKITAKEAVEWGLANEVIKHEDLISHARERALGLIPPRGAGLAIKRIKRSIHEPFIEALSKTLDMENEGLNECMKTHDFGEGLMSRIEKREAQFKGE